jgi:predicted ATPase
MIEPRAGAPPRPLPSVGVGVSQVLPILVAGLLAPSGGLLLFEQPELHLHARAQARLADFFLALAEDGVQCVVETHSETLVNQFRYRIVEHQASVAASTKMYFVSQNESGHATFERVTIDEFGSIANWPDGFFDETMLLQDRIMSVSLRQRARRRL